MGFWWASVPGLQMTAFLLALHTERETSLCLPIRLQFYRIRFPPLWLSKVDYLCVIRPTLAPAVPRSCSELLPFLLSLDSGLPSGAPWPGRSLRPGCYGTILQDGSFSSPQARMPGKRWLGQEGTKALESCIETASLEWDGVRNVDLST